MLVETLPILSIQIVDLRDMTSISIADTSTYNIVPISANIAFQITAPGYQTVNIPFTPLSVNTYKCVDLGITCNDSGCTPLPDGIYSIIYSVQDTVAGNPITTINKHFIKIDQIKCAYEHAFLSIDLNQLCHDHSKRYYMDELKRCKMYIDGSVVESNRGNYVLSNKYYNKAEYILNNLACNLQGGNNNRGFFNNCGCK